MPGTGQDIEPRAVFVLGASSSGKTTLCNALAQDLQLETELYIREVARNVMKTQGFSRKHTHLYEMQEAIMLAQLQAERSAAGYTGDGVRRVDILLLSDRSAIDPVVYAATSGTPDAQDMQHRLLETPSLQQNMAFYRRSLFGAYKLFTGNKMIDILRLFSCIATCRGLDHRRWNQISTGPVELYRPALSYLDRT